LIGERELIKSLASGRHPHAFLLAGPRGAGKKALARRLCAFHCTGSADETALAGNPNYLELGPEPIKVDDVRFLGESASLSGFNGGKRAFALLDAHRMNVQAQNKLLKTLEEPPDDALFVLTGNEQGLLPTIRSRCAVVRIGARDERALAQELTADGADAASALLAAALSDGVPEIARAYAAPESLAFRKAALACLEKALFGPPPFEEAGALIGGKGGADAKKADADNAARLLDAWGSLLRDALAVRTGGPAKKNADAAELAGKIARAFTIGRIQGMISMILQAQQALFYRANPAFTVDAALIRLSQQKEKHA